eukprot:COSAG02_NODE_32629_length_513_cov_0.840580_1_plen_66_part_10
MAADLRRAAKRRISLACASPAVPIGSYIPGWAALRVFCAASTVSLRVDDEEPVLVAERLVLCQCGV